MEELANLRGGKERTRRGKDCDVDAGADRDERDNAAHCLGRHADAAVKAIPDSAAAERPKADGVSQGVAAE
jgi:hypothetical protein